MLYCYTSKHGPGLPSSVCYQRWALFHGWICKHLKEHSLPSLVNMGTLSRHHSIMQHVNYTQLGYSKISSTQSACLTKYVNHTYSCLLGESTVRNHENSECCLRPPCLEHHMVPGYWRSASIVI